MFVPQTKLFRADSRHALIHGQVIEVGREQVTYLPLDDGDHDPQTIRFDYLIYALGARMPQPINVWSHPRTQGTKLQGTEWLQTRQKAIKAARSVLIVGGGALGVRECPNPKAFDERRQRCLLELASDIAAVYKSAKSITLLHSRSHLLNRFDTFMHDKALERLQAMGVNVELEARVDKEARIAEQSVMTTDGREWIADEIVSAKTLQSAPLC